VPQKVYPRVRGGIRSRALALFAWHGLSPRARGNRQEELTMAAAFRSIPACAGEPGDEGLELLRVQVYPRVRGGTARRGVLRLPQGGLSPRARGNHGTVVEIGKKLRSIPACAGEPRVNG